jgi:hypothetical protein
MFLLAPATSGEKKNQRGQIALTAVCSILNNVQSALASARRGWNK